MTAVRSAIYEGVVTHRRIGPVDHRFRYPVYYALVDLDEVDQVRGTLPAPVLGRFAPVRFERADYLGDPGTPLDRAVRDLVERERGVRPDGPIRLLTQLRTWGWLFNPISLYFCYQADGTAVRYVVAEVTNTPWHERHAYVIEADPSDPTDHWFPKQLHVSPFMEMDQWYRLLFTPPGDHLTVRLENHQEGERVFVATLSLHRRAMTRRGWWRMLARHPLMTLRVSAGIYRQAVALWRKRVPFVAHPARISSPRYQEADRPGPRRPSGG